jgi:hypothetical protein
MVTTSGRSTGEGATDTPERTVPQGKDPPGSENGPQQILPRADKEVVSLPPVKNVDIYTQAPNPEARHEEIRNAR